jgi:hypothetical protein
MYEPQTEHCPFCSRKLGLLARLSGSNFCSDDHRTQYLAANDTAILSRLGAKRVPSAPRRLPERERVDAVVLALSPKRAATR